MALAITMMPAMLINASIHKSTGNKLHQLGPAGNQRQWLWLAEKHSSL